MYIDMDTIYTIIMGLASMYIVYVGAELTEKTGKFKWVFLNSMAVVALLILIAIVGE